MSERERWIVYPLLFLALGAALRDKLLKQTKAKQIVCERIFLVDNDGRELALLNGAGLTFEPGGANNGHIEVNSVNGQNLFERGRPVATRPPGPIRVRGANPLSLPDLLRSLIQQRGVQQTTPTNPEAKGDTKRLDPSAAELAPPPRRAEPRPNK